MKKRTSQLPCEDAATTRREFLGGAAAFALLLRAQAEAAPAETGAVAGDATLCRRLHLDLAGRLPTAAEARAFAGDADPAKAEKLVDRLLAAESFADYWSMRYADILRVKSEFPINLWPNAVYVYHRRIHASLAADESWLDFARALLSATGSNFRVSEVNFLRATAKKTPEGLSEVASLTFLGAATADYADYFRRVAWKPTREWKEEIVYLTPGAGATPADFAQRLSGDLADAFARAQASRVWYWLFDARPDAAKARELGAAFAAGGHRLKPFVRGLVLSGAYRASAAAGFPARRLDAEVLDDAICDLTGAKRDFQSIAPEPFTYLPPARRSILVEDGSIASAFLLLFGRPPRDTGLLAERDNRITAKQRLYLFNSGKLYDRLGRLANASVFKRLDYRGKIDELYWRFLGRAPAAAEQELFAKAKFPVRDVAWCLLNSREFIYRT